MKIADIIMNLKTFQFETYQIISNYLGMVEF